MTTVWKCNMCGNTTTGDGPPPELCPFCKNRCEYVDVTCYLPECGGQGAGTVNPEVFEKSKDPSS